MASVTSMLLASSNIQEGYMTHKVANGWCNVLPFLLQFNIVDTEEITTVDAEKYRFDMYGLFKHVLNIPDEYIYPHILANGYDSSYDYNGNQLRIKMLDLSALEQYYNLFIRTE